MLRKKEITFFVDAMLGNIAKKLRLLGYDSKYFSDIDDGQLIGTQVVQVQTGVQIVELELPPPPPPPDGGLTGSAVWITPEWVKPSILYLVWFSTEVHV